MRGLFALVLQLAFIASAFAHIYAISGPTTYTATTTSSYTLTFSTTNSPTVAIDFGVTIGLYQGTPPSGSLGTFFSETNLVPAHSSTGTGSFTLSLPLHATNFYAGSGTYTITAAVTSAFGALYATQLEFFMQSVTVTV